VLAGASLASFVLHAAYAPVLAGSIALAVACAVASAALRGRARLVFAALAVAFCGVVFQTAVRPRASAPEAERSSSASADGGESTRVDTSPTSGVSVRIAIHGASARLLAAHPLAGVGPGQFPAQFPPFRDPAEIEKSSHGRLQA